MRISRRLIPVLCVAAVTAAVPTESSFAGRASCFEGGDTSRRGAMKGDVNGDGNRDVAFITAGISTGRCRYYLKVDFGRRSDRIRLRGDRFVLRNYARPMAMVQVDEVPGKEVGVLLAQGASVSGAGLFTARQNVLRRVDVTGRGAPDRDIFLYGGSIAFQAAVDCARNRPPGQVIYTIAIFDQDANRYRVRRRWFQADPATGDLARTPEPTQRASVRPARLHERFYEFRNSPFYDCPGRVR